MAIFLSTFENRLDKKGRISIPAQFRAVLSVESFNGIIAYPSFVNECVEACGLKRIERISDSIDELDPYSDSRDAFAVSILGGAQQLAFDGEGRVMLPEILITTAKLTEKAMFVGKGQTFEIWSPQLFNDYSAKAREHAKQNRGVLTLSATQKIFRGE